MSDSHCLGELLGNGMAVLRDTSCESRSEMPRPRACVMPLRFNLLSSSVLSAAWYGIVQLVTGVSPRPATLGG